MAGKRNHPSSPSILLIGATSLAGHEIVNQLVDHSSQPTVHIFCDKSTDLHDKHRESCASLCYGDSSRATDVLEALRETEANIIILAIDNNRDDSKSKVLTDSAWAVCSAMKMPGFSHISTIVLSSFGAGTSRIKVGRLPGYGRLLARRRKNSLKDCTGQESAFLVNGLDNRTVIIRTTDLTYGKSTGNIVEFGDKERAPSFRVDRVDVANYVATEITNGLMIGRIVNITGRQSE